MGVAALACAALALATGFDGDGDFTPEERATLARGELVTRALERRRGQHVLVGGLSWLRVHAPREQLWSVVTDPTSYGHFLPSTQDSRVVARTDDGVIIQVRHRYGLVRASYHAALRFDHDTHMVSFSLDTQRPHDIRAGYGFMMLTAVGEDRTDVTWAAMADVGADIVAGMLRPLMQQWMLRVPECLRNWTLDHARC